jgi:hypothetical protein
VPKPTPVNGIPRPPLFILTDFWRIVPLALHLFLGLVNDVMQHIYKELLVIYGTNPAAALLLNLLVHVEATRSAHWWKQLLMRPSSWGAVTRGLQLTSAGATSAA